MTINTKKERPEFTGRSSSLDFKFSNDYPRVKTIFVTSPFLPFVKSMLNFMPGIIPSA